MIVMGSTAGFVQHTTLTAYYRAVNLNYIFTSSFRSSSYSWFSYISHILIPRSRSTPTSTFFALTICMLYYFCTRAPLAHCSFPPNSCMLSSCININSMYYTSNTLSIHFVSFLACVDLVSYYITKKTSSILFYVSYSKGDNYAKLLVK